MEDRQPTPEAEQLVKDYQKWQKAWLDNEMLDLVEAIEALARVIRYRLTALGVNCPDEIAALNNVLRHIETRQ